MFQLANLNGRRGHCSYRFAIALNNLIMDYDISERRILRVIRGSYVDAHLPLLEKTPLNELCHFSRVPSLERSPIRTESNEVETLFLGRLRTCTIPYHKASLLSVFLSSS